MREEQAPPLPGYFFVHLTPSGLVGTALYFCVSSSTAALAPSPCQRVALPFLRFKSRLHNIFERLTCGLTRPHVSDEAYTYSLATREYVERARAREMGKVWKG